MGRAERGKRVVSAVPFGRWRTSTFIASLRHDGLVAPCVFNGAVNGELFIAYGTSEQGRIGLHLSGKLPHCARTDSGCWINHTDREACDSFCDI
jgi:hypothetical protein